MDVGKRLQEISYMDHFWVKLKLFYFTLNNFNSGYTYLADWSSLCTQKFSVFIERDNATNLLSTFPDGSDVEEYFDVYFV